MPVPATVKVLKKHLSPAWGKGGFAGRALSRYQDGTWTPGTRDPTACGLVGQAMLMGGSTASSSHRRELVRPGKCFCAGRKTLQLRVA